MQPIEFIQKYKWYLFAIIAITISVASITLFFSYRHKSDSIIEIEQKKEGVDKIIQNDSSCNVFVDVSGAVNKPNVYCFKNGQLVIDALKRAGGYVKNKEAKEYIRTNINLARPLVANEKVYFPYRNELQYTKMKYELVPIPEQLSTSENKCISINSSTLDQLDTLTGIGPTTAQKIIDARPFKNKESLKDVSGIGDQLYTKIINEICL